MTLEERVIRLEKQNRWLRFVCAATAMLMVCAVTMGAIFQDEVHSLIRVKRLHIVGPQGQVRTRMFVTRTGETVLQFSDANGKARLGIGCEAAGAGGGAINFWDGNDNRIGRLLSTGFEKER